MRTRSPRRRNRAGFTLMEVLLVLAILVVLGSLVVVSFANIMGDADSKNAKIQISALQQAVRTYYIHVKQFPTDLNDLMEQPANLAVPTRWKGPYLDTNKLPVDPWGRPYKYQLQGKQVVISSAGADGVEGTDDDVDNLKQE